MEESFIELLRSICQTIFGKTNIDYTITDKGENFTFTYDEKFSLYRICQQAFFKINKHSKASKVSTKTKIKISDNGIGFNVNEISSNSLGIKIMKDRAKLIGAKVEIKSTSNQGTVIDIEYEKL